MIDRGAPRHIQGEMSLRRTTRCLLPISVLTLGLMACDQGNSVHFDIQPDGTLDYGACEGLEEMECEKGACGTDAERAALGIVLEEIEAAGLADAVSLADLRTENEEFIYVDMVYANDWVRANLSFLTLEGVAEAELRGIVRYQLSPLQGLDVVALEDAEALFSECGAEIAVDHCAISTANGLSLQASAPDPDDDCINVTANVDLASGTVTCWESDTCEPQGGDTPLVVKFDNAPVEFAPAAAGASFDIAGAGECTTHDWPLATTPWLALDRDQNGSIDSGAELFGSGSVLASGQKAQHGFMALAELDTNRDGRISRADEDFGKLLLWSDYDGDKRSTFDEAPTAQSMGLLSIDLDYRVDTACDARGNCEVERATFRFIDEHGALAEGEIADVHLACQ